MSKIVALAGLIGSGKSTAAQAFIERGYKPLAFADALKDTVATVFDLDRALLEGDTAEGREWRDKPLPYWDSFLPTDQVVTPRFLLQYVGTEVFRSHWNNIWVLAAEVRLQRMIAAGENVVVTDLRFINEWEVLRSLGARIIGVHRRTPKWLSAFYRHMEKIVPDGPSAKPEWVTTSGMLAHARACPALRTHKVHESEWQHLLFPHYDVVIHNSGTNIERFKRLAYLAGSSPE